VRHHKCNVCRGDFTCAPPTRHELMASVTGPELAALIEPGCIIAAHHAFSSELTRQNERFPEIMRALSPYNNWINGVYLITGVTQDDDEIPLQCSPRTLAGLKEKVGADLTLSLRGRAFRVVAEGDLKGVAPEALRAGLLALDAPAEVVLRACTPNDCGEDHIAAVNLHRRREGPIDAAVVERALEAVRRKFPEDEVRVELEHYDGGPCDSDSIVTCIVYGGRGQGWAVKSDLFSAVSFAHGRAADRQPDQGEVRAGQTVRLEGLVARADLNEQLGLAVHFNEASKRWMVRLGDGAAVGVRPKNLVGLEGANGRVLVFWGDARWSRTQLLGETSRGHWGFCRASVSDLIAPSSERRPKLDGRLGFAPETAMTEDYMRSAQAQMSVFRERAEAHVRTNPEETEPLMGGGGNEGGAGNAQQE